MDSLDFPKTRGLTSFSSQDSHTNTGLGPGVIPGDCVVTWAAWCQKRAERTEQQVQISFGFAREGAQSKGMASNTKAWLF